MNAATLLDVLLDAARRAPDQVVVHVRGDGGERPVTFRQLLEDSLRVAGGFRGAGVAPGTCVPVLADHGADFQPLFWGALAAGLVPVPLAPDARRVRPVWEHLGRPPVAVDEACAEVAGRLPDPVRVLRLAELRKSAPLGSPAAAAPDDLAFLQFSSGSTGSPKGVELTHAAVLANLRQLTEAAALTDRDVVVSWMPYFHDMGLIGTHLAPMAARAKQVRIAPLSFAKNPRLWFEVASAHRATLLSAANFALALAVRRVPEEVFAGLDLRSVRLLLVGAEPISPVVWREFAARTRPAGLDPRAATPVYGLAEATLAVTFPPPGEVAVPVVVERAALGRGRVVEREPGDGAVELMDVGLPVPGCAVRVTDDGGRPLGDRRVGHVEVRGPQVARGYHGLPDATSATFGDGWLRTGDLGFLRDGRLCVSGRHKDVLFVNGRTFHAPDLEEVAAGTPGVPAGTTVVVGSTDPVTGGERVVVFVAWARPPRTAAGVLDRVAERVRGALGHDDVRVLALPPSAFPRTTSGKVRRQRMRTRFEEGAYRPVAASGTGTGATGGRTAGRTAGAAEAPQRADAEGPDDRTPPATESPDGSARPTAEGPDAGARPTTEDPDAGARPTTEDPDAGARPTTEDPDAGARPTTEDPDAGARRVGRTAAVSSRSVPAPMPRSRAEVRRVVREVWAKVLGLPEASFADTDRFAGLGGGSLKAMEALAALEQALDITLGPAVMRNDTVAALTDQLLDVLSDRNSDRQAPQRPAAHGERERPTAHGGQERPATDGGQERPAADGGQERPAADGGRERDAVTAVVGLACRFPGAGSPEEFWELLMAGRDAVTAVPAGRWDSGGRSRADERERWGAFLDDPAAFDADHFGIGAEEARALDPQARIFLELAHEALERAGYAGPRRRGLRIGVFAAVGDSGYRQVLADAAPDGAPAAAAALTGNLPNLVAARVAHCLDLDGPALAVDTACSSGLVALHLARRSLADGECDLAVVGGVNLHLTPAAHQALEAAQALSPTGRSRAFSSAADGFVPGEGGAALVVRRLAQARRDEDEVLAVVRGTAVNNDGTSLSLLAPNPLRQHEVIERAHRDCGVDPASVTYVEAHGTGTAVGDPIELRSLAHAFPPRPDGRPRLLGSVKTNVGHLLNAAALPSLVKVVLALGHGRLPASLHHAAPLPAVERSGFALVTEPTVWDSPGPRRAGINAFGFGGTNAHAVLEEAPPAPPRAPRPSVGGPHLLTLSAGSAETLRAWASRLGQHLRDHPDLDEADVCRAVGAARDERPHRLALVADGDLRDRLVAACADGGPARRDVVTGTVARRPRTVFVLPGQGALRPGPGRALYATAPVYRATLDEASALVGAVRGRELAHWCVDGGAAAEDLASTEVAQPLLVAHGVGLARQLAAWGVRADAVVGHSVGELAAACVAGVLSLREAVGFAARRGRLMGGSTAPGAMAAVLGAEERKVAALVDADPGALAVAADNGPGRLVISGTPEAVRRASARLTGQGATVRPLRVTRAFHSPLMEPVAQALADAARELAPAEPAVPLMSTLTAAWQPRMDSAYLRDHALRPVRFGPAVARLAEEGYDTFVELGAGGNLSGPIRAAAGGAVAVVSAPVAPRGDGEAPGGARELLQTVARLWVRGVPVDRTVLDAGGGRVPLPPAPYRRRRYWPEPVPHGLLHAVVWRPAPLSGDGAAGRVVVSGADGAAVRRLADGLAARGVAAVPATGDVDAADTVILLGGTDRPTAAAALEREQGQAVTALREALALLDRTGARRLLVVTRDAHVTGEGAERPDPAQAVLGGLALAVPEESAGVVANWVDLSAHDDEERWLRALAAEAAAPQADGAVAWRGGRRSVRAVVPTTGDRSADAEPAACGQPAEAVGGSDPGNTEPGPAGRAAEPLCGSAAAGVEPLPADGAYLITGGGGGIGSALARDLAGRGRPVLVLAGRSARAPRGLVEELTALGADARYVAADVTVPGDVERLVAQLPPLDAVFHAAGTARPGSLRGTPVRETVEALGAKTTGTVLLAEALRRHGQRPGVCVAFSSVSSVRPGLAGALGAYAAGNAFLDAFAGAERAAGRPWLSVNLGPFRETGLAAAAGAAPAGAAGRPLATAPALAALRSACGTDAAQLVLADLGAAPVARRTVERNERTTARAAATSDGTSGDTAAAASDSTNGDTTAATSDGTNGDTTAATSGDTAAATSDSTSGDTTGDTAGVLRELLAQALGVAASDVDDDTPFLALGLDSLGAVDLVKRLERRLGRDLPTTLFFEHRTVRELAAHLGDRAPEPAEGEPFPLTPVQRALYTSSLLHPEVPARGHLRLTVRGPLDTGLLGRALATLAERHGMLRLRVDGSGPRPVQRVAPPVAVADWYEVIDCAAEDVPGIEADVCNRPFDLAARPPVRAVLLREGPERAHLLLVVHHAAADGYSLNVLAEELWSAYAALSHGERPPPAPRAPDFARYAARNEGSGVGESVRRHWAERLAARGEPLRLPYDGDPDAPVTGPIAQHPGEIGPEEVAGLERLAAAHDVSLFHLLLAAYVRCLARWSGRRDVAVNVARAGREDRFDGVERLVGPLADTLPLLCEVADGEPVTALARRVRRAWLESERHAGPSSLDLAGLLPGAGAGPRTVSPAGFSFARFPAATVTGSPVQVRATGAGTGSATTRLSLLCWSDGPVLRLSWNFPAPLFERATVARLDREFRAELAAAAHTPVTRAEPHPPARTEASPPLAVRLLDRFRTHAASTAVDAGEASLTYAALDRASAALAARLRALGVRRGELVGLLTEPGADTVVGVVGILRAGAGWVPLDPEHPRARLADQLARTGATTVVCHSPTRAVADALTGVRTVPADGPPEEPADAAVTPPDPDAIAYVIFTSGSTGRPKAVPVTHRAMENYLDWAVDTFGYGPGDRLAQTASPCFDASVRQLLAPLLVGGTVVGVPRHLLRDPELLLAHVERARVTVWSSVPTLWEQLLSAAEARARHAAVDLSALRWVHVGGEALPVGHVRRWFDLFGEGARIANLYGPTETTINAACHIVDARPDDGARQVPIGRAAAGALLEVVDDDGAVCGAGEAGELLIAGTGLSPGYLGEPELTARAFTFRAGRRWYRSGDRVRRSADGVLEFLGRIDAQVKIRGNRVEPGEVEAALQTCPGVALAAVTAHEGRLLAFVTARAGAGRPTAVGVRRHLAGLLPSYMLPARITVVDALPLTGTGKVDRSALTAVTGAVLDGGDSRHENGDGDGRTAPVTATERRLAAVWSELLGVTGVCREDDFFALGGDSLLVLQVFARLAEHEGPLPRPTVVYRHRTLAALARAVDAAAGQRTPAPSTAPASLSDPARPAVPATPADTADTADPADPADTADTAHAADPADTADTAHAADPADPADPAVPVAQVAPAGDDATSPFPVTPGQRGFLLADALTPGDGTWLARLRLSGPLDPELFQRAVDVLVERHGMLRTVFPAGARPPVQQELPRSLRLPVVFETVDGPLEVEERAAAEAERRLEPWAWPLLRLRLLTLDPLEHVLLVHAHHLIGDGYSAALLMRELTDAYDRLAGGDTPAPAPLRTTFRDHVLARTGAGGAPAAQAGLRARAGRLGMPYRPPVLRAVAAVAEAGFGAAEFTLDASSTTALRKVAADAGSTLYAPLLTAYYQELAAVTGRADLVVGLAVSGRDRAAPPDAHRVFGPFATAVPVRPAGAADSPLTEGDFGAAVRRIAAEAEAAREYGDDEDVVPRHADGLPVTAQFFFTYLDFAALAPRDGGVLRVSWDGGESTFLPPSSATDLFLAVRPDGDGLRVALRGSAAAFPAAALNGFARSLHGRLVRAAGGGTAAAVPSGKRRETMDAALVGYLPAPEHLARLAGLPERSLPREEVRALLFPDGAPRLLETVRTPLGRSGFVCVPLFADELGGDDGLVAHTARAVSLAGSLGARCVSLAGMIPSLTGYGFDVLRFRRYASAVTTGHAATVVSVVKTVHAALDATGRDLGDLEVAFAGLGSIGASSLELLLALAARPPRRLLLCDVPGSGPRLRALGRRLRACGAAGEVEVVESGRMLPDAVHGADLLVTAVSGAATVLDVDRLRPGAVVVDDSFPHCFDTARALARMREHGDVLVLGGGLLDVGRTDREVAADLPAAAAAGHLAQPWIDGTLASCRTESLLHAAGHPLPPVHGLVDAATARAHWDAVESAGITAAPLHLLGRTVDVPTGTADPERRSDTELRG